MQFKKSTIILYLFFVIISFSFVACAKERGNISTSCDDIDWSGNKLVGSWVAYSESGFDKIRFFSNGALEGLYYPFNQAGSSFYINGDTSFTIFFANQDNYGNTSVTKKYHIVDTIVDDIPYEITLLTIYNYNSFYTDCSIKDITFKKVSTKRQKEAL